MPSKSMRSSSSRRSSTPQVKAPCAPPPCNARLTVCVVSAAARRVVRSPACVRFKVAACISCPPFISMRGPAAIDRKSSAGDRLGSVAGEEGGQGTDLLDGREALVWLLGEKHFLHHLIARQ